MKFQPGANRFRILMSALLTWDIWTDEQGGGSSITRVPYDPNNKPNGRDVNHAWNLVVWDYQKSCVSVLSITQKTVQEQMSNYIQSPGWKDYRTYDFIVNRTGQGKEGTRYSAQADLPQLLAPEIWNVAGPIIAGADLRALLVGGDPLNPTAPVQAPQPPRQAPAPGYAPQPQPQAPAPGYAPQPQPGAGAQYPAATPESPLFNVDGSPKAPTGGGGAPPF